MLHHFQIICFLKDDNKYRERKINGKSNTKQGKQLLAQLEANIARAKVFESFQPK